MKKIISQSLIVLFALQGATAYAENNGVMTRPLPPSATSTQKRLTPPNPEGNMGERGTIVRRISNRFEKMNTRYEATIERLGKIKTRIQSRIDKIKTAGGKTSDAEKLLVEAQTNIDAAKTALASLKAETENTANFEVHASTTEAKTALANVRKMAKEIEKDLQKAHTSLSKALGSLKGMSQMRNATSTKDKNDQ